MIDEIVILTLQRSIDRYDACSDRLVELGAPRERIRPWIGLDNVGFEKTRDIAEYAIREFNFTFLKRFLEKEGHNQVPIAGFAQSLSYFEVFRYSVESGKTLLILHDDRSPMRTYPEIVDAMESAHLPGFFVVSIPIDDYFNEDCDLRIDSRNMTPYSEKFFRGFQTPSDNFIISPSGADCMFDTFSDALCLYPFEYYEGFLWALINGAVPCKLSGSTDVFFSFHPDFLCLTHELGFMSQIHDTGAHAVNCVYKRPLSETRD